MSKREGIGLYITPSILKKAGLTPAEKMVMAEIVQLSERHEKGCFATKSFIAKRLKMSERTVYYALQNLQSNGLIKTIPKSGKILANLEAIQSAILADPKVRKNLQKLQADLQKLQSTTAKVADVLHIEELPINIQLTTSPPNGGGVPETKPEAETKKPRPRNLLFDAIAELCLCPIPVPKRLGGQIAGIVAELKPLVPEVTPEEVKSLSRIVEAEWPGHTPQIGETVRWIGILRSPKGKAILDGKHQGNRKTPQSFTNASPPADSDIYKLHPDQEAAMQKARDKGLI